MLKLLRLILVISAILTTTVNSPRIALSDELANQEVQVSKPQMVLRNEKLNVNTSINRSTNTSIFIAGSMLLLLWHQRRTSFKPRTKIEQVNRGLQSKLLNLLANDRGAAERLLNHARRLNPGRAERWYWEKVIWDLERDRG